MARDKKTKKAAASKVKRKDKRTGDPQRRTWFFTSYRPLEDPPKYVEDKVAYLVYQRESGNEEHREHWQGYIRFHEAVRLKVAQTYIGENAHCEVPRFNEPICRAYCTKEETRVAGPYEFGKYRPIVGQESSTMAQVMLRIREGASMKDIEEQFPAVALQYHNVIEKKIEARDEDINPPPEERSVQVQVLVGKSGVGKSYRVRHKYRIPKDCYKVAKGRDPFGRYKGQKVIFFDEFAYWRWEYDYFNDLLDEGYLELDARYKGRGAHYDKVIICTNKHPRDWWPNITDPVLRETWQRRCSNIVVVEARDQVVELI